MKLLLSSKNAWYWSLEMEEEFTQLKLLLMFLLFLKPFYPKLKTKFLADKVWVGGSQEDVAESFPLGGGSNWAHVVSISFG